MARTEYPTEGLRALVDGFIAQLTGMLAAEVERRVTEAVAGMRMAVPASEGLPPADGRRGGRLCPVPGCGQLGAGPRNRWFCREHARSVPPAEQKALLERHRREAAESRVTAEAPGEQVVRLRSRTPRPRRSLEMACRVDGCPNRSGGPRSGFICDVHRAQLTPDEQLAARTAWNARKKAALAAAAEGEGERPALPLPVPPIVRRAEPAQS